MSDVQLRGMDVSYSTSEFPNGNASRGDIPVEAVLHDLALVLRDNGDLVLNKERNLSLTPSVVRYLNGRFRQLAASPAASTTSRDNADVEFLWQFLQKVPSVKLIGNTHRPNVQRVSLHVFQHLTHLTLRKVNVVDISGLQGLRTQLQSLTCERSLKSLKSAIVHCGADEAAPFSWPKLVNLDVSYNSLPELDESLRFTGNLVSLNLSHNQIVATLDLFYPLNDVMQINLGFNRLERIPTLCSRASRLHLRTLILRGNNLDNLQGLQHLRVLQDVDLSDNCLLTHHCLAPLADLATLVTLTLAGNPLAFHANHRCNTCAQLSPHVNSHAFVLDAKKLAIPEVQCIPRVGRYGLGMPPSTPEISSVSRGASPLTNAASSDTTGNSPLLASTSRASKQRRRNRTRAAAIEDIEDSPCESVDRGNVSVPVRPLKFESSLKLSRYQLLKEQIGSEYLQQLELPSNAKPRDRSSSGESGSTMPASTDGSLQNLATDIPYSSTPADATDQFAALSIPDTSPVKPMTVTGQIPFTRDESDISDMENEHEGNSFLVTVQESDDEGDSLKQQRFVSLSDNGFLQERDYKAECVEMLALTCLMHASLSPSTPMPASSPTASSAGHVASSPTASSAGHVASSPTGQQYTLHLEFDYSRRDRRQRDYILDSYEHGQAMLSVLLPVVENNRAAAAVCPMLECLTCLTVFRDSRSATGSPTPDSNQRCPKCSSAMLVSVEAKQVQRDPLQPLHVEQALNSGRSSVTNFSRDVTTPTLASLRQSPLSSILSAAAAVVDGKEEFAGGESPASIARTPHTEARRSLMSNSMLMEPPPRPGFSPKPMLEVEKSESDSSLTLGTHVVGDDEIDAPVTPIIKKLDTSGLEWSVPSVEDPASRDSARQPVAVADNDTVVNSSATTTPMQTSPMSPSPPVPVRAPDGSFASFLSRYSIQESGPQQVLKDSASTETGLPPGGVWQEHQLPGEDKIPGGSPITSWIAGATAASLSKDTVLSSSQPEQPRSSVQDSPPANSLENSLRVLERQATVSSSPTLCYSLDDCSYISHHLRLHLQLHFFSNDETSACVLRAPALVAGTEGMSEKFIVISSSNWYLCDLEPNQKICAESWPVRGRKLSLTDVCFIDVGLGCQTVRVEFDKANACFTFLIGDETRCLDFVQCFTDVLQKHLSSCRHACRGVFYSNYLTLHHFRQEVLHVNAVEFDHVAYEILSRHCLRQSVSLVPVDSSGALTVCIPGQQLVDLLLDLKLEGDRKSAIHMCQNLLRDGLLFVEGDSVSRSSTFCDKASPSYGFSPQTSEMIRWSKGNWKVDTVVAASFIRPGGDRLAVEVLSVDKTVFIVQHDYRMPPPRLECNQPGQTGKAKDATFFTPVTSQSIESMSALILYEECPQYLGIDFFAEDVAGEDSNSSCWKFEFQSAAAVKSLCSSLTQVWEKEFEISLHTELRPGNPPDHTQ